MSDLNTRIREAASERIQTMAHLPTCVFLSTGYAWSCECASNTLRLVVAAVLDTLAENGVYRDLSDPAMDFEALAETVREVRA